MSLVKIFATSFHDEGYRCEHKADVMDGTGLTLASAGKAARNAIRFALVISILASVYSGASLAMMIGSRRLGRVVWDALLIEVMDLNRGSLGEKMWRGKREKAGESRSIKQCSVLRDNSHMMFLYVRSCFHGRKVQ